MLTRRVQMLFDQERYERVSREATRRKVSFAEVVREAVDLAIPRRWPDRADAAEAVLNAPTMPVPSDVAELKDEIHSGRTRGR